MLCRGSCGRGNHLPQYGGAVRAGVDLDGEDGDDHDHDGGGDHDENCLNIEELPEQVNLGCQNFETGLLLFRLSNQRQLFCR